jgi:two-component system, NarL family, response regulator LiaR
MMKNLTARELEIVEMARSGMSNEEIAEKLVLCERMIRSHLWNIGAKLGLASRKAVEVYLRSGV